MNEEILKGIIEDTTAEVKQLTRMLDAAKLRLEIFEKQMEQLQTTKNNN